MPAYGKVQAMQELAAAGQQPLGIRRISDSKKSKSQSETPTHAKA